MEEWDDLIWRARAYGPEAERRERRRLGVPPGHVPAPRRKVRSDAMQQVIDEIAARKARMKVEAVKTVEHQQMLDRAVAQEQRVRDVQWWWRSLTPARRAGVRDAVAEYGREVTEAVLHQRLPADLNEEEAR